MPSELSNRQNLEERLKRLEKLYNKIRNEAVLYAALEGLAVDSTIARHDLKGGLDEWLEAVAARWVARNETLSRRSRN